MSDAHAHTAAYTRDTMLPQQDPPATSIGAIGWMRANLFSGWFNSILTVLSLGLIYAILSHALPWFYSPTWNASSLSDCREIIAEAGYGGACWAVINERWIQFMFGFYPPELYWRPIAAFILLGVALAPILFAGSVPGRLIWFSAVYPFLFPWLLWGGTIWAPLAAAAGFVIGFFAYRAVSAASSELLGILAGVVLALIWWLVLSGPVVDALQGIAPLAIETVESRKFGGFMLSITIGVVAIACSLPLGIVLALGRQSDLLIVKSLCVGFIEFIRGVPLITLLFTASLLLNYFLPPGTNFDIILRVIIMVTLFSAAYIAEVIRGGLAALPRGQYEAADALGLDYWKAQRLIIMPQALKISIPGIVSSFIGLFKDTTLVVFVALLDPLKGITDAVRASIEWKGIYWEPYIFVGAIFFLVCFSMSRYSMYLENRLKREHR